MTFPMPLKKILLYLLISLFGSHVLSACGGASKPKIIPGPSIPGLDLSGGYDCAQFGFIKIKQMGNSIQGSYEGVRRLGDNGTFKGRIEGDLLWIDWIQPGDLNAAILPTHGKGWLRIQNQGQILRGRWGYDDSREDGGEWLAEKSDFY